MEDYGKVYLNLEELMKEKCITKNQLSYKAKMTHTQLSRLLKHEASRIDFDTIARLCYALDCQITDLIIYEPPKK